jgi:hypothetical protein
MNIEQHINEIDAWVRDVLTDFPDYPIDDVLYETMNNYLDQTEMSSDMRKAIRQRLYGI